LDDLSNTGLATFDLTKPLAPDLQGFGHLGLKRNQRLDDPGSSSNVIDLAGGTSRRLGNGDTLRLTFGLTQTQSADIEVDNTSYSARIDWTHAKPISGILWSAGLEAEQTDYDNSPYAFDGRHDLRLTATLSAEFTKISTYGFSPVVTLNLSSNDSSIGLYDTQTTGIGLSFRSRF
jgi:hypothetical protein